MTTVLVVESDPNLGGALRRALGQRGCSVLVAVDAAEAIDALVGSEIDAVVLDVTVPGLDSAAVCRQINGDGDRTPIIVFGVGARGDGCNSSPDHLVSRPPAFAELLERVRSMFDGVEPEGAERLEVDDLVIVPATREVRRGGRLLQLTATEFTLVEFLARSAGTVLPREIIIERVWGYGTEMASNSLEVYVGYLRRKLEAGGRSRLIHTVRGVGYVLRPPRPDVSASR